MFTILNEHDEFCFNARQYDQEQRNIGAEQLMDVILAQQNQLCVGIGSVGAQAALSPFQARLRKAQEIALEVRSRKGWEPFSMLPGKNNG